jgi:hypothetical protein
MGYKTAYPAETIEAYRAFIARRRDARPSEDYRTPTDEEWDAFRDDLTARIDEAEGECWLGEVERLQDSLAAAEDKLAQIDRRASGGTAINLGVPA